MGIERISEFWHSWKPLERLGKGGNGEVYRCVHEEMGVKTYSAIKVINISSRQMETFTFNTGSVRSFCRNLIEECINEINVMLSLKSCPNIVAIEDFKVIEIVKDEEWEIFIRMELLTCLTDYLRDRVLTQDEVVKLGVDLCTALELCHSKNIMHRDIKPANIFLNEAGMFKLGDFGIARTLEMATAGFSQKGTVTYVAPEVMYSNDYTKAVDIYSLGLVLYQLANNNRLPFLPAYGDYTHTMQNDAIKNRLKGDTFPPACNADEALNSIFRIACEFEPKNRFQSAGQMREVLRSLTPVEKRYFSKSDFGNEDKTTIIKPSYELVNVVPDNINDNAELSDSDNSISINEVKTAEYERNKTVQYMAAGKAPDKLSTGVKIAALIVVISMILIVVFPLCIYLSDNKEGQENDYNNIDYADNLDADNEEEQGNDYHNINHNDLDVDNQDVIVGNSDLNYIREKGSLVIGITDYAPMAYKSTDNEWIGFDVEFAEAFAEYLGVNVVLVEIDWDNKYEELLNNNIDCIWNGYSVSFDTGENFISCSDIYAEDYVVVFRGDSDVTELLNDFMKNNRDSILVPLADEYGLHIAF